MRRIAILMIAGLVFPLVSGCRASNEVMWSAENISSDLAWISSGRTAHTNHGFGGESVWTTVAVKQNVSTGEPVQVLEFVDDDGPDPIHDLKMNWLSPQHLDITYRGSTAVNFQAVKAFGKDVTVEKLP